MFEMESQTNEEEDDALVVRWEDAVCLLLLVPGRWPLVGSNPSSPRLATFCFAEKVLLPCLRNPGRCGFRGWSVDDIKEDLSLGLAGKGRVPVEYRVV